MTTIAAAYSNIRLIRRKIVIAEREIASLGHGPQRDASLIRLASLTRDLVRALHDFDHMGFEEIVAQQLSMQTAPASLARTH